MPCRKPVQSFPSSQMKRSDGLPTYRGSYLPIRTQPVLSLCMSGDVHEAGPGLSLKLWEASHVFWVSGFGERPEERGGDFFGWIPTQSGFYSWLVSAESALPRLRGEGNYLSQGRSQTGERTQNPDLEPFGYTLNTCSIRLYY